jgi:hypothetical protein
MVPVGTLLKVDVATVGPEAAVVAVAKRARGNPRTSAAIVREAKARVVVEAEADRRVTGTAKDAVEVGVAINAGVVGVPTLVREH